MTVPYGSAVDWLLVVTNTGNTHLTNLVFSREDLAAGGGDHGATTTECAQGVQLGSLAPGVSTTVICQTANVRNTAGLGSGQDVVNTAQVAGTPADADDVPLPGPDGHPWPDVYSEEEKAEANTVKPDTTVDVEKYDAVGGPVAGDHDEAPGKLLKVGESTPISFTVTNDGTEALTNIRVTDRVTSGFGSIVGLTCDFGSVGGPAVGTSWAGPLAAGASFDCSGTLTALAAGQNHADTVTVDAAGQFSGVPVTDSDDWHGHTPHPALALEKWVCNGGTGCAVPTGTVLDRLAQGQAAGGWVKATTVVRNTAAQWLLVLTNTGDTDLADVTLTREDLTAGGTGHGLTTGCAPGAVLGDLAVGQSLTVTCRTESITNSAALGSGQDVINTAQAAGTPVDDGGEPLYPGEPPIKSAPDTAEVATTPSVTPTTPAPSAPPTLSGTGAAAPAWTLVGAVGALVLGLLALGARRRLRRATI